MLNDTPGKKISAKTRELILQTARELEYFPNLNARNMRMNRAMSIGIVSGHNNINITFSRVLRGIKQKLDEAGYSITLLSDNDGDAELENLEYIRYYRSAKIDGILFLFCELDRETADLLEKWGIPYAMVNESGVSIGEPGEREHPWELYLQTAEFCRDRAFREIRFFLLEGQDGFFRRKCERFTDALRERYPAARLSQVILPPGRAGNPTIRAEIDRVLRQDSFDLAVTPHQRLGWLVQGGILAKDFVLPQRIKHICFAPSHAFDLTYPTITSFEFPLTEMGEAAAGQMLHLLAGEALDTPEFSYRLKLGGSTETTMSFQGEEKL